MYVHMCVYTCVHYMGLSKRDFLNGTFLYLLRREQNFIYLRN